MEKECLMDPSISEDEDEDERIRSRQTPNVRHVQFAPSIIPTDKWNFVYMIFLFYGIIIVLSWSFFLTAEGYWMYKFRNLNSSQSSFENYRTELQTYFTSYMSIASCVPAVVFYFINAVISKKVSIQIRLIGSLIGMIILFILTTTLTKIDTDAWQVTFFTITMATIAALNASSSIFQGGVMGLAACFPSTYMQANMNGQAIGGVFAVLCGIVALAFNLPDQDTGFIFFSAAVVILFLGFLTYFFLKRRTYYRYYLFQMKELETEAECHEIIRGVNNNNFWSTLKSISCDGYVGFITFFTTLAVYPSVAVLVVSTNYQNKSSIANQYFIPVGCFLIFNLGDLTGRIVAGILRLPKSRSVWLPIMSTIRIGLIPLMMLCNVSKPNRHLPVVFDNDVYFVVLNLVLGLTNGYLVNLAAIYAPKKVEAQQREMAGSMMAFFFGVGLACGALISDLLVSLV